MTYQSESDQGECLPCPHGYYTYEWGSKKCIYDQMNLAQNCVGGACPVVLSGTVNAGSLATDGDYSRSLDNDDKCAKTAVPSAGERSWARVDLGETRNISFVRIWNSLSDSYSDMKGFDIRVGDYDDYKLLPNCMPYPADPPLNQIYGWMEYECHGRGRHVFVTGPKALTLCEIEVIAGCPYGTYPYGWGNCSAQPTGWRITGGAMEGHWGTCNEYENYESFHGLPLNLSVISGLDAFANANDFTGAGQLGRSYVGLLTGYRWIEYPDTYRRNRAKGNMFMSYGIMEDNERMTWKAHCSDGSDRDYYFPLNRIGGTRTVMMVAMDGKQETRSSYVEVYSKENTWHHQRDYASYCTLHHFCPPGHSVDCRVGLVGCRPCPRGSYKETESNLACKTCPQPSTTTLDVGAFSVGQCECHLGYEGFSHLECTQCGVGTAKNFKGFGRCSPCPDGTYANVTGARVCETCTRCQHGVTFAKQRCDGEHDAICQECTRCPPGEYALSPCTPESDTVCSEPKHWWSADDLQGSGTDAGALLQMHPPKNIVEADSEHRVWSDRADYVFYDMLPELVGGVMYQFSFENEGTSLLYTLAVPQTCTTIYHVFAHHTDATLTTKRLAGMAFLQTAGWRQLDSENMIWGKTDGSFSFGTSTLAIDAYDQQVLVADNSVSHKLFTVIAKPQPCSVCGSPAGCLDTSSPWPDRMGNQDAQVLAGSYSVTTKAGFGAARAVRAFVGDAATTVHFADVPTGGATVCSMKRHDGEADYTNKDGRIIDFTGFYTVTGHWNVGSQTSYGNFFTEQNSWRSGQNSPDAVSLRKPDDWLASCLSVGTEALSMAHVNGYPVGEPVADNSVLGKATIHDGYAKADGIVGTKFALHSLVIWDRMLTPSQMKAWTAHMYGTVMDAHNPVRF